MSEDAKYRFRLPSGIVHESENLDFIKKTYPDAIITDRVTLDSLGQAVFQPYEGQQPFESRFAEPEVAPGEDEVQRSEEDRAEERQATEAEQPAKAKAKK